MRVRRLQQLSHPDFNDLVVHFTGRDGRSNCSPNIVAMSPRQRLLRIVVERRLLAFPMFGVNARAVCFTESTTAGNQWLVRKRRYPPYGIAFKKQAVFERGGGPAFYVRGDEWDAVTAWPEALKARATRFWPGADPTDGELLAHHLESRSEWIIEREWRALPNVRGFWRFDLADAEFLIVGDDELLNDAVATAHPTLQAEIANLPYLVMDTAGEIVRNKGVAL
jgi:hypothetical protein